MITVPGGQPANRKLPAQGRTSVKVPFCLSLSTRKHLQISRHHILQFYPGTAAILEFARPLPNRAERMSSLAMECIHRTEPDGTIHSICPRCYGPVGNAHRETDLKRAEADHICDPVLLAYFERARSSGAKQPTGNSHEVDPTEVETQRRTSGWRKVSALTIGIIAALLTLGLENFDSISFGLGRVLSGV